VVGTQVCLGPTPGVRPPPRSREGGLAGQHGVRHSKGEEEEEEDEEDEEEEEGWGAWGARWWGGRGRGRGGAPVPAAGCGGCGGGVIIT